MSIFVNKKIIFSAILSFLIVFILVFASPGCKSENISTPSSDNVSVGFYSENPGGDNTLVLTEVKFLVRKLMLEAEDGEEEFDVNLGPLCGLP
ncbi:MAG: hypothetical protein L0Y79_02570 [Chlorobi bacterium]|nr:hypothetical protein [Chlorobiota bacterium]MCI0715716.1 hypothetical protein [Chlorobiota bacterium]